MVLLVLVESRRQSGRRPPPFHYVNGRFSYLKTIREWGSISGQRKLICGWLYGLSYARKALMFFV